MARVNIKKEILEWAVARSGIESEKLLKVFPKYQDWIDGSTQPTFKQIENLSKATYTPLGFFFLQEPPNDRLPIPYFRTLGDRAVQLSTSINLLDTVQTMQQRQEYMRDLLVEQGESPLDFVKSATIDNDPIQIASNIREVLGLNNSWAARHDTWTDALHELREVIEKTGILVMVNGIVGNNTHRKLDPNEFRGFVLIDEYAPLVFINGSDGKAAQMFTLAHEVAHVWIGSSAAFDLRELQPAEDPVEQICNKIAAELLVPETALRTLWNSLHNEIEPYQSIARYFKVSSLVAARRTLDLELITKDQFLEFYRVYVNDERRKKLASSEGGDFYASQVLRIGKRFGNTVVKAAREGKILYTEAFKLTGLRGKTFDEFATKLLGSIAA